MNDSANIQGGVYIMYRNTTHGGYSSVLQTSRELFVLSAQNEVRRP